MKSWTKKNVWCDILKEINLKIITVSHVTINCYINLDWFDAHNCQQYDEIYSNDNILNNELKKC